MKFKLNKQNNASGFTLIELLISMVVFSIIVAAMYGVVDTSNRSHAIQNEVVDAQNNLRAAVGLLTRELRMAGFAGALPFVTQPTNPNQANPLKFNTDVGLIEYRLDHGNLQRMSPGGGFETIAENISEFTLDFSDIDERKITFNVTADTARWDRERSASVTVQVRNM